MRRNIRKVDWNCFRDFLSQSNDWSEILSLKDINLAWDYLVKSINSFLDLHAPLRSIPLRNFRTTSKIRTLLRATRRFYKIMIHSPTTSNIAMYERQKLLLKKASDQESYAKEDKISKSSDSRLFWSYVNKKLSLPRKIQSVCYENEIVSDPQKISNIFNQFFASVYSVPSTQSPDSITCSWPKQALSSTAHLNYAL